MFALNIRNFISCCASRLSQTPLSLYKNAIIIIIINHERQSNIIVKITSRLQQHEAVKTESRRSQSFDKFVMCPEMNGRTFSFKPTSENVQRLRGLNCRRQTVTWSGCRHAERPVADGRVRNVWRGRRRWTQALPIADVAHRNTPIKFLKFSSRAFSAAEPAVWSSLDINTRSSETFLTFRCKLKTGLFRKSYDTWALGRYRCAPDLHTTDILGAFQIFY